MIKKFYNIISDFLCSWFLCRKIKKANKGILCYFSKISVNIQSNLSQVTFKGSIEIWASQNRWSQNTGLLIRNILWREWSHKTGGPKIQVYLIRNILWREWSHKTGCLKIQVYLIWNILWREWSHKIGGPEIQVYLTWNILWREIKIKVT